MDLPDMAITFECGEELTNVGVLSMALRHHLTTCTNEACRRDVESELAK